MALIVIYGSAAISIHFARLALPAYADWLAVGLLGLACWEFEPVLKTLLDGPDVGNSPSA